MTIGNILVLLREELCHMLSYSIKLCGGQMHKLRPNHTHRLI